MSDSITAIKHHYGYINVRGGGAQRGASLRECVFAEIGCGGGWGVSHGDQGGEGAAQARWRRLRERKGEVEALAKALEGQEGVRREVAGGHLAVRRLVAARGTLALEATDQQVDAGAAVPADSCGAAAGAR